MYNDFGLAKTDQKFSISNEEACAWTSAIRSNSCERDRDSLSDILEALGTNLSEFFQEDKNDQFVFRAEDFFVDERESCTVNWIVPNTQKNQMEPILIELPAGGESFEVEPHNGEEFGYVLDGSVILECDGERSVVRRGETFYLHGKTFHCLKNERKTAARVLWVCTPPLF